ncbi:tetratricopeptide repeat protein [Caenimonas terrae]|uniref:Tetratricopeptide repeat protein n=1 Tax=Caenimonas terrae TaxID=696074 RepID=A0ABW0NHK3_9BURK
MTTSTPADPIAKRLQTVQHLITSGKLSEAAERLNGVAKSAPRDPRVYLLGMRLGEAAGNPQRAEEAARRAVELEPTWPVSVTEYAALLARLGRFDEALDHARRAVALDPRNPQVLARMVDVAHDASRIDLALSWLNDLAAVVPGNDAIQLLLATDLRRVGRHEDAVRCYSGILERQPGNNAALLGRAQALHAMKDDEAALKDCAVLLEREPDNQEYQFLRALAAGETPPSQPEAVVKGLFDSIAYQFDDHLVRGLKYKLPRQVADIIKASHPDLKLNVLDLGCGTGLLGACLGRIDGYLIGVDLSEPMTAQAAGHQVYDRFHHVNVLDALKETPASLYHVIAALDVFIYVGDLTAAIPDAYRILLPGGQFIFSCETAAQDEADLVLRPSGRYAHKRSHVEALCRAAGFTELSVEEQVLRMEGDQPLAGFLVVAKKPA